MNEESFGTNKDHTNIYRVNQGTLCYEAPPTPKAGLTQKISRVKTG